MVKHELIKQSEATAAELHAVGRHTAAKVIEDLITEVEVRGQAYEYLKESHSEEELALRLASSKRDNKHLRNRRNKAVDNERAMSLKLYALIGQRDNLRSVVSQILNRLQRNQENEDICGRWTLDKDLLDSEIDVFNVILDESSLTPGYFVPVSTKEWEEDNIL